MLFETTTTARPPRKKVKRQVNRTVYELLKPGAWIESYLPDNYLKAFKLYGKRRILVRYVTAGDFRRLVRDGVLLEQAGAFRISRKAVIALRANNAIKRTYQIYIEDQRQGRRLALCVCSTVAPVSCNTYKPRKK